MLSPTRTLQTVSLVDLLGAGLIVPQLPSHARQLGCNHLQIGAMGSLYSAFQFLSGPMIGSLSDVKGRKNILFLSICLSGLAYVFLGITNSTIIFFALRAFLGLCKHTQLLTEAMTPEYEDDQTQLLAAFGKLGTLSAIGMSIGPIVGGHVVDSYPSYGFTIIALLVGVMFAVNSVLIKNLPKPDKKRQEKLKKNTPKLQDSVFTSLKQTVAQLYTIDWRIYWEMFLFKLLISFCTGVYLSNYAVYLKTKYEVSLKTIGYVTSIIWGVQSFCSYFIANINKFYDSDKDFTTRNFHVFLSLTVSLTAMIFSPTASIYVAFVPFVAISSAVGNFATLELILRKTGAKQRGTVLGAASNIKAMSGVICPLLAGVIAEYIGSLYVIYVSVALAALGTYKSYRVPAKKAARKKQLKLPSDSPIKI